MNTNKKILTILLIIIVIGLLVVPGYVVSADIVGEGICEDENVLKALTFVGYLLFFAKLLVPILLIFMGTMDYYKAITGDKNEELSKQTGKFIKRIILGIVVFLIPTILRAFLVFLSDYSDPISLYEKCASCALDPITCDNK